MNFQNNFFAFFSSDESISSSTTEDDDASYSDEYDQVFQNIILMFYEIITFLSFTLQYYASKLKIKACLLVQKQGTISEISNDPPCKDGIPVSQHSSTHEIII